MARPTRQGRTALVSIAGLVLATAGCLTGFNAPLGPASESFIEKPLLGDWTCRGTDDPDPVDLTFTNFDDRQYLLQSNDHKSDPYSHRVIATRVQDATFLSVRAVAPKEEDEWTVLQYSFGDPSILSLSAVAASSFEDVQDDPQAVRDRLAEHLHDPDVIHELMTCSRPQPKPDEPQP